MDCQSRCMLQPPHWLVRCWPGYLGLVAPCGAPWPERQGCTCRHCCCTSMQQQASLNRSVPSGQTRRRLHTSSSRAGKGTRLPPLLNKTPVSSTQTRPASCFRLDGCPVLAAVICSGDQGGEALAAELQAIAVCPDCHLLPRGLHNSSATLCRGVNGAVLENWWCHTTGVAWC